MSMSWVIMSTPLPPPPPITMVRPRCLRYVDLKFAALTQGLLQVGYNPFIVFVLHCTLYRTIVMYLVCPFVSSSFG